MKKKGFTLIEVVVALSLLSFVILMSSTFFDKAIQNTPTLKRALEKNSDNSSKMESGTLDVKEAYNYYMSGSTDLSKKPKNYDKIVGTPKYDGDDAKGAPINLTVKGDFTIVPPKGGSIKIKNIEGYFLSISSETNELKYNSVGKEDNVFSFVSTGYIPSPTASVEDIYWDESQRFVYMPKGSGKVDVNVKYVIANKNKDKLQKTRLRFLKAPVGRDDFIYTPYTQVGEENTFYNTLTSDMFYYVGDEFDGQNNLSGSAPYTIEGYISNKQDYLDSIDRDIAADIITFNTNGYVGEPNKTFFNNENNKQNTMYYIGLPFTDQLTAHYDHNLIMSKSKTEPNIYYSLLDLISKDKTAYGDRLKVVSGTIGDYIFDWENSDIRDFLGIGTKTANINIPKAFLKQIKLNSNEEIINNEKTVSNIQKSYGNSMYYNMPSTTDSIRFSNSGDMTLFIKYNTDNYYDNYGTSQKYPYTIVSYNFDYNTGDIPVGSTIKKGILIYAQSDGALKQIVVEKNTPQNKITITDLGYNIKNTNLYANSASPSSFKLDKLKYDDKISGKNDDRQGFNILAIRVTRPNELELYVLERDNTKDKIETNVKKLVYISGIRNTSKEFIFGAPVKHIKNESGTLEIVSNSDVEPIFEISDIVMYSKRMSDSGKEIGPVMDYLYRKFLTENERKAGRFDEYFIGKY